MSNQIQKQDKPVSITDEVLSRVNDLKNNNELITPPGYSPENALKSAYLMLQETKDKNKRCVLETCTKSSIANTLLNMVIQGLSPAKKQCYFVAYGSTLQLMKSYMGTVAVAKRLKGIRDIKAYCVYEGDEFEQEYNAETGTLKINYKPNIENVDFEKMKAVFAVIVGDEGILHTEVMNMKQISSAWSQGYGNGNSDAHIKFKDQMAKKTVINRACKMYVNTSDDSDLLAEAFNNSEITKEDVIEKNDALINHEIEQKANKKTLDIDAVDAEFKEIKEEEVQEMIEQSEFEDPLF